MRVCVLHALGVGKDTVVRFGLAGQVTGGDDGFTRLRLGRQ